MAVHPPVAPTQDERITTPPAPPPVTPPAAPRARFPWLRWAVPLVIVLIAAGAVVLDVVALLGTTPTPPFRLLTWIAAGICVALVIAVAGYGVLLLTRHALRRPSILAGVALLAVVGAGATTGYAAVIGPNCLQRTTAGADLRGCDFSGKNLSGRSLDGVNLAGVNLANANLSNAQLSKAGLTGATLTGANLSGATLNDAALGDANLSGANLTGAHLGNAGLAKANLTKATLDGAQMSNATLTEADLSSASMKGVNLSDADATSANLSSAVVSDATLTGVKLDKAMLIGTNLTSTLMQNASLDGATLSDATMPGANLAGAVFTGADLTNADLSGANLEGANLASANLTSANLGAATAGGAILQNATLDNTSLSLTTLTSANFTAAKLTSVDFTGAKLIGSIGLTNDMLAGGLGVAPNEVGRTLVALDLPLESATSITETLQPVCSGQAVKAARAAGPGASFHPMVVFGADTPANQNWGPPAVSYAEYVACVDADTSRSIQSCQYRLASGGAATPIDRMQHSRHFRVFDPRTGKVVLEQTIKGSVPGGCPQSAPETQREVNGSSVGDDAVVAVLAKLVGNAPPVTAQ